GGNASTPRALVPGVPPGRRCRADPVDGRGALADTRYRRTDYPNHVRVRAAASPPHRPRAISLRPRSRPTCQLTGTHFAPDRIRHLTLGRRHWHAIGFAFADVAAVRPPGPTCHPAATHPRPHPPLSRLWRTPGGEIVDSS